MDPVPNDCDRRPEPSTLQKLPAEIIHQILQLLSPLDLVTIGLTCSLLYQHSLSNTLWLPHLTSSIHRTLASLPARYKCFRDLYAAHHPFWFLTQHRIWFSDTEHTGKLVLCRYSAERDCIEGHSVVAEPGADPFQLWEWDREVILHTFSPRVRLHLDSAVIKLNAGAYSHVRESEERGKAARLAHEIPMESFAHGNETGPGASLHSRFMLTRPLPEHLVQPGTALWPPLTIPSPAGASGSYGSRTRNSSTQNFTGTGHNPSSWNEVNQAAFRLRKWMQFSEYHVHHLPIHLLQSSNPATTNVHSYISAARRPVITRIGEDVTTFATVDRSAYVPTVKKPWRGIWVGDYSAHGCEFLLVIQPDDDEVREGKRPLPHFAEKLLKDMALREKYNRRRALASSQTSGDVEGSSTDHTPTTWLMPTDGALHHPDFNLPVQDLEDDDDDQSIELPQSDDDMVLLTADSDACEDDGDDIYRGRIEAVKLTGDPNVPRGEFSWICPDIGPKGLVRIADEEIFKGARVLRSVGHIAAQGFKDDDYTESQLILVSHDTLAQYWIAFGHVSFYKRVNIDEFTDVA